MEDYRSKRTGDQIEALLDIVAQGGGGSEGGTITEAEIAAMGFTKNLGTITEVKMNGVSKGTSGVVDLGTVLTEHQDISGKQDKISDLETIIEGAALGATALQSVPSEYVTESELTNKGYATTSALDDKVDKVSGKQLSTEDFTSALKAKLEGLSNYNDTEISNAVSSLQAQINTLVSGNANDAINSFNEIIAFLDGVKDTQDLSSIIASIEQQIAGKMDKVTLATVATSGNYDDLTNKPTIPAEQVNADWNATSGKAQILNKPTIPSAVTESTVSGWGFTKNTGTYSKPSGGIPKTDLASAVQTSLGKADSAVQPDAISEFVTVEDLAAVATSGSYNDLTDKPDFIKGVAINGTTIANTSSTVYLPNASTEAYGVTKLNSSTSSTSTTESATPSAVKAAYDLANGKQDKLVSGTNIKTINGASILGSGNITIEGGSSGVSQEAFDSLANTVDNIDADVAELTKGAVITHILGDYRYAENTDGMVSREGVIYALPDSVNDNSSEDDIIATANTLKTINGQSLIGEGDITISGDSGGEKEVIHTSSVIELLQPNKIYIYEHSEEFEIQALEEPETEYAEYHVIFSTPTENSLPSIILPANVMWANGVAPDVPSLSCFELSIVYWVGIGNAAFNAVLTPFNYVE